METIRALFVRMFGFIIEKENGRQGKLIYSLSQVVPIQTWSKRGTLVMDPQPENPGVEANSEPNDSNEKEKVEDTSRTSILRVDQM